MNELIPKEIKEKIPSLYSTENQSDPMVFCKLFLEGWTWYITEISIDDDICFGYVISPFSDGELGYFSLKELEQEVKGSLGLGVERDLLFKPTNLSKLKKAS